MFIPFSAEEVDRKCNNQEAYVALDVTAPHGLKKYLVCNKLEFKTQFLASFQLLDNSDLGCIVNFAIHRELQEGNDPKYKQLYLTMALRCVKEWAVLNNVSLLCIHTEETLMPEIFINDGFALRKAMTKVTPLYRGSLQIKE